MAKKDKKEKMIKLSSLKLNPENPRDISPENLNKLKDSISEFERMLEIRPIIIDEEKIVLGGNMRIRALKELGYKEIPEKWIKQIKDLSPEQKREFIVKDNLAYGKWDYDLLLKGWDADLLEKWGLDSAKDLVKKNVDGADDGETIEVEKSIQIEPPQEYIVILADANSIEWEQMKELLKLKIVRKGGYKKNSPFDATGIERVLKWKDMKKRMGL